MAEGHADLGGVHEVDATKRGLEPEVAVPEHERARVRPPGHAAGDREEHGRARRCRSREARSNAFEPVASTRTS